ncbi:MAG: orotate phosphoribosyltransferase [Phenylobacterium sp.]|uniref:orotate phosphoribosyltransferase n=1 Tax=Phenylobacterium sp. TaxID=1871053 RepID=UPI003BB7F20E
MDADAKRALATDIDAIARLQGSFVLRSGAVATEYFDKYRFEADPALLARVAQAMIPLLPADTEVLAGVELGGVPIATAMSLATGLPCAFVRKQAKTYGTCLAVEGSEVKGRRVVMIEDVISTGGAVRDAAVHLADAGAVLTAVVCTLWRGDGEPRIEGLAVPLLAAFRKEDLERR